ADADDVKTVMEGESVTLNPDLTQIQKCYLIEWRFGDSVIAQTDGNDISYPSHTEIFRGRLQLDQLKLDHQTGSLIITNTRTTDAGLYTVKISSNKQTLYKRFTVTVSDDVKTVMEGESVTLNPDLTQIQKCYLIEWRFGDSVIAQTDGNDISYPSHTEIFRGRLQLDQSGSLTIKNIRTKHSGLYKLHIHHSTGTLNQKFTVYGEDIFIFLIIRSSIITDIITAVIGLQVIT
uniref:Immunoglobulin domain-containing protein n=1 Tax=Sinocyclocheilus rhinocerous TaxID=307959 RepID=A0A673K044_9TELE